MTYKELGDRFRRAFAERAREAEGLELKDRPPEKKVTWFKTKCPKCKEPIRYSPKENWDGLLKCGSCGHLFRLSILDHFSVELRDEVS